MELCYFMPITPEEKAEVLGSCYVEQRKLVTSGPTPVIKDILESLVQVGPIIDSQPE